MSFIDSLKGLFQSKASEARIALTVQRLGQPNMSPANYAGFSKEGYQKNAIVYRCISMIAKACAGIQWELYTKGKDCVEVETSPILTLIDRPNPMQGWSSFFEAYIAYLCISGNSYVEAAGPNPNSPPLEIWPVRPDLMSIVGNAKGYPAKYIFKSGGEQRSWDVDPITFKSRIMHTKTFHPTDPWFGMSPMEAALLGIDQNNSANKWNLALLQNSASPSGVLRVEPSDANPGGGLTNEQFLRMKSEFESSHQSARNAGRPLLLEGGLSWQSISLSPKEMEWMKGREVSAIDICNVYGVPSEMLGFGAKTYANYKEARQAFYEDTILPLMDMAQYELNRWLLPMFKDDKNQLKYDKDDIEALVEKREAKYTSLGAANFLSINEKRQAAGYEKLDGWDVFIIGNQILENPEDAVNTSTMDPVEPDPKEGEQNGEEETSEETDQETSSSEEVISEEGEKGWKTFNLLNQNEKKRTWRTVNARKKLLEKPFVRSLESDFDDLARKLEQSAKGKESGLAEYAMQKVIDEHMLDLRKTLKRYITYTVEDFGGQIFQNAKSQLRMIETKKNEKTWKQWADNYIEKRTAKAITEIEGTTRKQVRRVVQDLVQRATSAEESDVDVASELRSKFDSLSPGRARTIARTEIGMASNQATIEAAKSLEIPGLKKEWVSLQDDRTRDGDGPNPGLGANHLDMNGVQVEIDEKFTVPPDVDMDGPGDESGGADQVCNCRCTLIFKSGVR
jgi:HK97 family phage portal protein